MVVDLHLEEMIMRKEKPRIGSTTGASMVENTGMLQLGFNPLTNTSKKRNKKEKAANRSNTSEAQRQADWRQLARVWVTAQADVTQDRKKIHGGIRSTRVAGRALNPHVDASYNGRR
jgi:hypothetical protein